MNYDEKLRLSLEKIARRTELKAFLQTAYIRQKELKELTFHLEETRQNEDKDVRRLEGFSLNAILSTLSGSKAEKLEKERREAQTAAFNHEEAIRELSALEDEIHSAEEAFASLRGCDREYRLLLDEKLAAVKASASPAAENIAALETELMQIRAAADQIRAAVDSGRKVLGAAYSALELHGDVITGINPVKNITRIMDAIDESHLIAEAQSSVTPVQESLHRFCVLLRNLNLDIPAFSEVSEVLPGVDFLYTAARFSAGRVMNEIEALQEQIKSVLDTLGKMIDEAEAKAAQIRAKLDNEILNAPLPPDCADAESDD